MLSYSCYAQKRLIALTIDDLPFVGEYKNVHLDRFVNLIKENNIPVTGFVIASKVRENNLPMLYKFREAGLGIGNHTFSHINLNKVDTATYIQEIDEADKILSPVLTEPKYFRYPYLAMGKDEKKQQVMNFLEEKNYHIAPITIDSRDFIFNQRLLAVSRDERRSYLEELKVAYLDFIWQQTLLAEKYNRVNHKPGRAQILLIHANILNAYVLTDIINLYREKGYTFISLQDALKTFSPQIKAVAVQQKTDIQNLIEQYFAWD